MQFSLALVASLLSGASAHLVMKTPQQWEVVGGAQAPLAADHSDFPCQSGTPAASVATYDPGSEQTLQLMGSAVHGGGSGQMVITYDTKPTKDSVFRVMTSWEGNHPVNSASVNNANLPADPSHMLDPIKFTVPSGLPKGDAVVAWVWWNKVGNREMYMKCSTVTIGGSSTDQSGFEALPTMFEANDGNGCIVPENTQAIKFKNPGPNVVGTGDTTISCDSSKAGTGSSSSGSSSGSSDSSSTAASATAVVSASASAGFGLGSGTTLAVGSAAPTSAGVDEGVATAAATTAAATDAATTDAATTATATDASSPAETTAAAAAATTAASTDSSSSSGSCTEGAITCNSTSTWSLCGSGAVHDMGAVPAGMQCVNGAISAVASTSASSKKREVRFSPAHLKRHAMHIPAKRLALI